MVKFDYRCLLQLITFKMSNKLKIIAFALTGIIVFSCTHAPKVKEAIKEPVKIQLKTAEEKSSIPIDTIKDNLVAFIAGMANNLPKGEPASNWSKYAREIDRLFERADTFRFKKMKLWANNELIKDQTVKTVFYPFSGPDFLNADIFYPDADQYILIGMEPVGSLPDISRMSPSSVKSYLGMINNSLKDVFKRSYFITARMSSDLGKTQVNGITPLMSLFIKRTGHQIVSIHLVGIDSSGNCQNIDSIKNRKNIITGVRVDFLSPSKNKIQSVLYFRTDISDKGLEANPGFNAYLSQLPQSYSYLKAASYLMHSDNFKMIRNVIFDKSLTILQDDSGIAYKYFDKSTWNISLYGVYVKPKDEFKYINEPDLKKAYSLAKYRPVPYSLGYNWRTDHSNLLYAIKDKAVAKK